MQISAWQPNLLQCLWYAANPYTDKTMLILSSCLFTSAAPRGHGSTAATTATAGAWGVLRNMLQEFPGFAWTGVDEDSVETNHGALPSAGADAFGCAYNGENVHSHQEVQVHVACSGRPYAVQSCTLGCTAGQYNVCNAAVEVICSICRRHSMDAATAASGDASTQHQQQRQRRCRVAGRLAGGALAAGDWWPRQPGRPVWPVGHAAGVAMSNLPLVNSSKVKSEG